jgi:hypothetical protein
MGLSTYAIARRLSVVGAQTGLLVLEATPRIELGMEVLQTSALPLGYVATQASEFPSLPSA